MSRLDAITIAIVVVCLAALGYLVYKIVNLVNPPEEPTTSIQDSYATDTPSDTYTDWDDDTAAGTDTDAGDAPLDSYGANTDPAAGTYSEDELDNTATGTAEADNLEEDEPEETVTQPDPTPTVTATPTVGGGRYMVIAGTYRQRANADRQVSRLRKLGYDAARVELFDNGTYALVLVDRFSSLSAAQRLVGELKNKGVEAFVDKK